MIRRPPRATRTDTLCPTRRSSDLQRTDGSYIILSTNGDPEDEKWQFPSGSIVQCEIKTLSGGNQLVAVSAAILENLWLCLGSGRSEEHTSELQSLMRNAYAVFCLKKKKTT